MNARTMRLADGGVAQVPLEESGQCQLIVSAHASPNRNLYARKRLGAAQRTLQWRDLGRSGEAPNRSGHHSRLGQTHIRERQAQQTYDCLRCLPSTIGRHRAPEGTRCIMEVGTTDSAIAVATRWTDRDRYGAAGGAARATIYRLPCLAY